MKHKRTYILDTNVLIHDPRAIFAFDNAQVMIPIIVLEELDKFKNDNSERGRNVREVIRQLDMLRSKGRLNEGVMLDNGSMLLVGTIDVERECPERLSFAVPDNHILNLALCMKDRGTDVVLISKDLNMRVKADVIGIQANDYLKDEISSEHFYKGWVRIGVPAVQLKKSVPQDLLEFAKEYDFSLHEYAIVESQHNPHVYKVFRYEGRDQFRPVVAPNLQWGIEPRNIQQLMALDLLFDESIQLVTLLGPAGTGKTFLTLVAALHKLLIDHAYVKILISRPVIPLGPDIGYLPGTLGEKLHNWMQPIYDNMEFIVHVANNAPTSGFQGDEGHQPQENGRNYHGESRQKKGKKWHRRPTTFPGLDELVYRGKISLEAMTYMRGRSIPYQFIFIDEVQNLTPHEVKTVISRVGEGSKIVLAGDPYQIDSPYLDFLSNGLMVATQRFKGQQLFGTAFLEVSERSELSKLAGTLL